MRFLACLLLLLASQVSFAQQNLVIGIKPSQQQIDDAKKKAAEGQAAQQFLSLATAPIARQIEVGQYVTFTLGSSGQLWLWNGSVYDPKADYPLMKFDQPKGIAIPLVRQKVDGTASVETIPASDKDGGILLGTHAGHLLIAVIVNGDSNSGPIITQILDLTVGPYVPPEPPTPPVDPNDPIIIAAKADLQANQGTKSDLGLYKEYIKHVASDVPSIGNSTFRTLGEFHQSLKTGTANILGDPNGKLSSLRHAVGEYLSKKLPTNPNEPWTKELANKIAKELSIVAKLLDGVK